MMKSTVVCIVCLCSFLAISQYSFPLLYIDAMSLDVSDCFYYDNDTSSFVLSTPIGGSEITIDKGDIHIYGGGYDYDFVGTISVTPSATTGTGVYLGDPYADFTTGATMTVTATELKVKSTGVVVLEDVVLWEAAISSDWWYLTGTSTPNKNISVLLTYDVTGGAFFNGPDFRLPDFSGVWSFPDTTPTGSAFDSDLRCSNPSLLINAAVPEPATLMLLLAGGCMMAGKKK